jgi:cell division protein ZapA (FtsZ GTPase activity inhibitor)
MKASENGPEWVTVSVQVADRVFPLRVQEGHEGRVKRAAQLVDSRIQEFKSMHAGQDKYDYLAMSALAVAMELTGGQEHLANALDSFSAQLDHHEGNLAKF